VDSLSPENRSNSSSDSRAEHRHFEGGVEIEDGGGRGVKQGRSLISNSGVIAALNLSRHLSRGIAFPPLFRDLGAACCVQVQNYRMRFLQHNLLLLAH
jgi:hypothetical protein